MEMVYEKVKLFRKQMEILIRKDLRICRIMLPKEISIKAQTTGHIDG